MSFISEDAADTEAPDADRAAGSAEQAPADTRACRRAAREASETPWYWHPASQAAVVGAFSLIPARSWPTWLKGGLTWGTTGLVAALALTPGAGTKLLDLSARMAGTEAPGSQEQGAEQGAEPASGAASDEGAESGEKAEGSAEESAGSASGGISWTGRLTLAAALAGFNYGTWRFTWWADAAVERGLTKLRVPAPRLVQAGGAAALTYWQARRDERAQAERAAKRAQEVEAKLADQAAAQG